MTGMRSLFVLAVLGTQAARADNADALRRADVRSPVLLADAASPDISDSSLRQRAEDLARAASQRFSEILSTDRPAPQPGAEKAPVNPDGETFAPVWNWLARASQDYQDVVIKKLKSPDGWVVVVQRADSATSPLAKPAESQPEPQPELRGWSGLMEILRDWLSRANRSYRNEIVKQLTEPSEQEAPKATAEEPARAAPPSAPATPAAPVVVEAPQAQPDAAEAKRKADAEAAIKREAEAVDAKRKADAEAADAKRKADTEAETKREAAALEAKRKADSEAEAKRKTDAEADATRKAEDAKRIAEEGDAERKAVAEAEVARLATEAEEKRKAEREAKVRRAVQAATEAAAENAAPAAKEPEKTENSGIAPGRNAATSERAPAEPAPAESAPVPPTPQEPAHTASPDSAKARETVAEAPVPPSVTRGATSRKVQVAQADTGRKHARVRRHKPVAHAKHRKHGYGHVHYKKHRALPVESLYRGSRCKRQCRCAGVYGYRYVRVAKPRKRVVWRGHAAPRVYASSTHVLRPYRVHHRKARRASLTYRHHRLYIPSHTY